MKMNFFIFTDQRALEHIMTVRLLFHLGWHNVVLFQCESRRRK